MVICALSFLIATGWLPNARAEVNLQEALIRSSNPIQSLSLEIDSIRAIVIDARKNGDPTLAVAEVSGTYTDEDWNLLYRLRRVPLGSRGQFKVNVPITGPESRIDLDAVGPRGELIKESVLLHALNWDDWLRSLRDDDEFRNSKKWVFGGSAGFSVLSYTQAAVGSTAPATTLNEKAISVKVSVDRTLVPKKWNFGASLFFNALPFGSDLTLKDSSTETVRYLGVNARAGYLVQSVNAPWSLALMGGVYFNTMFTSPVSLGYKNVGGPQFYPIVRRTFNSKSSGYVYFKYSPVGSGFGFLSLAYREIATGIGYTRITKSGHAINFSFDYADLVIQAPSTTGGLSRGESTSSTFSLGTLF